MSTPKGRITQFETRCFIHVRVNQQGFGCPIYYLSAIFKHSYRGVTVLIVEFVTIFYVAGERLLDVSGIVDKCAGYPGLSMRFGQSAT
ncbi:hypothetical protein ACFRFQ_12300 [Rhodococcus sp. NPDC056743]|uniref:hypothetical protein n=1 Tax=Rhodococcus sp. NPDC056743 TaxID=3345934 RepID=UPI00366C92BC